MRAAWLVVVFGVGCGGDGGGGKDGATEDFLRACDDSDIDGDCVLYTGDGWEEADVECATGALGPTCPGGAIGLCTLEGGTEFETVTSFYPGFWNDQGASTACSGSGGSWTLL